MTEIKRIKLQLVWDTFGREEFNRNDVYKMMRAYIIDNYDITDELVRKMAQGFEYYYAIGCVVRVAPCRYILDEEFFNEYVFEKID